MGLFDGMMGNVSEVDAEQVAAEFERLLAEGERVERAYVLIRDLVVFTTKRVVLVDKQGMTGKKIEFVSIPYSRITRFSVETAGTLDMDSELKLWVGSSETPFAWTFNRKVDIFEVQRLLAAHV